MPEEEIITYSLTPEGEKLLESAQALRRALSHHARAERDGVKVIGPPKPGVAETVASMLAGGFDVALVDDLLDELEEISERGTRVFELHFFAGIPVHKIAALMQVPLRVTERDWSLAKAWLYENLKRK
jgi:DNA-directed RNA polymerase specialized sigma24 family protein